MSATNENHLIPAFSPLVYLLTSDETSLLEGESPTAPQVSDLVKQAVRALLRAGGHKPSGRGRPASETLLKSFEEGRYPAIHPVVDHFNNISLTSGLPISVLDADKMEGAWSFRLGRADESYLFNPSGQELKLTGLLLLEDRLGPAGTPVKDAQRTKVSSETTRFFVVVWGTAVLDERLEKIHSQITRWTDANGIDCQALLYERESV